MENIADGEVRWPLSKSRKPIAILLNKETKKMEIPIENYVLIKRFSSKEGKQRINAGVLLQTFVKSNSIAIENHVNYIYKIKGKIAEDEAYGLTTLLNSRLYNQYFQVSNGSTQVNASEIRNLPFPSIKTIREIGKAVSVLKNGDRKSKEDIVISKLSIGGELSKTLSENN